METGFWGLIVKAGKRYEQVVEDPFHVSKACLEPTSAPGGQVTSLMIEVGPEEFILCNLQPGKNLNETLDLNFGSGDKVCFRVEGPGTIHLSGYMAPDDMPGSMMYESDEDDDDSVDLENDNEVIPTLVNGNKKRKISDSSGQSPKKSKKQDGYKPEDVAAAIKQAKDMSKKVASISKKISVGDLKGLVDDDDIDLDDDEEEEEEEVEEEEGEEEEESEEEPDDEDMEDMITPQKNQGKVEQKTPKSEAKKTPKGDKNPNGDKKNPKENLKGNKAETPGANVEKKTPGKDKANNKNTPAKQNAATPKTPKRTLKGGIVVEELKPGNGPEARRGKMVGMYYKGLLQTNKRQFDATLSGEPFKFRLGAGEVIKGWDIGLEGIKVGGKRRIVIPPKMAYGKEGAPPDIPSNSTLVFEVECKFVK